MSKGGSKFVTGLISFLLGFIFAILVEVAAVFGVYWFVMNKDINTIMATIGIPNTDDRYINTDKDNGGVTTLKELLSGVQGLVFENGELAIVGKSFDDITNLIPATQMVLDMFYGVVDDYIEIDHEAFESNPLMNLAQVLSDSVMNVKTGPLLEKLGMSAVIGDEANLLVKSLVAGAECDYATVSYADGRESILKLPVMCDYYMLQEGTLARVDYYGLARPVNGMSAFPENLRDNQEKLLAPSGKIVDGEAEFERSALYYVPCKVTASGVEEAEYIVGETTAERDSKTYKFQIIAYGEGTDFIAVEYNNGNFVIDYDAVYASLNADSTGASDKFTGYSYYEPYAANYYFTEYNDKLMRPELKTVSGKNYFCDSENKMVQLDALTLSDIVVDPFAPLDSVLVSEVIEGDTEIGKIFGTTTLGMLLRGEGVDEIISDLEVATFIDKITPENKVMCYIAYKISDLKDNGDNTYSAVYDKDGENEEEVTVYLDTNGYIVEVKDSGGNVVEGVKVKDVSALTNTMPITVLMDVRVDEPIMVYLGYGVTGVKAQTGDGYRYVGNIKIGEEKKTCYIATETVNGVENVTSVWYTDEGGNRIYVGGTKVNGVSERVNSFADDLTVGDVLGLDGSESALLKAIKDTPLSGMADRIDELTVGEIISAEELNKSSMLRQLKNTKVTELSTAIDKLFIQRVYAEEVYGVAADSDPALATEYHADWLYYIKDGDTFVLANTSATPPENDTAYDDALGHITQTEFDSGEYYTFGEAKGMWRLVLYKNGYEKAYTMNNFNNMVNSCADTVYSSTLYDLQKAGVIEDSKDLSKTLAGKELGLYTLEQLIDAVLAMPAT